jgi:streptomycin 6-kinase
MTVSVGDLMERWNLTPAGGAVETPRARIFRVRRNGTSAILKVASAVSDEVRAAATLRHFAGEGAVQILAEEPGALLLEGAEPGTPLTSLVAEGRDDDATAVIADKIVALHRLPPPDGFPTLEMWADGFRRQREREPHALLPPETIARAETAFRDLARPAAGDRLLHADLHHDNILHDEHRGWLAIDPKGIVGDPAYEAVSALGNPHRLHPLAADPAVMRRRIAIFAERLSLDPQRIAAWTAAHFVLAACWHVEDGNTDTDVANCLAIAEAAQSLV